MMNMTAKLRCLWPFVAAVSLILAGCSGTAKPKPAELAPNAALLGVKAAWSFSLGATHYNLEPRAVAGTLYLASSAGNVVALNAETGAVLWRVDLSKPLVAGVGSDGRYVSVITEDGELVTLEAGAVIWRQRLGAAALTAPLVAGARVFTVSADRSVYAFDAATGKRLWQQQRGADSLVLGQAGVLIPFGDTLVLGIGGRLVGLNPQTGASRWEAPVAVSRGTNEVERLVDLVAGVSRVGNSVCVRSFQTAVGCVDVGQGKVLWTKSASGITGLSGDADLVLGTEGDGKIVAWKRGDGERLWTSELLRWRGLSAPVLVGQTVVVGDAAGILHFLSRQDAAPLNRVALDGSAVLGVPIVVGKTLIAVTQKGGVFAFRPE
jgi:outer membrane protein assembly factor BamB